MENAALRLIGLLGAAEMQPCYSRQASEVKPLFSTDSEELNRALILTLARVISVAGCETQHTHWYGARRLQSFVSPYWWPRYVTSVSLHNTLGYVRRPGIVIGYVAIRCDCLVQYHIIYYQQHDRE